MLLRARVSARSKSVICGLRCGYVYLPEMREREEGGNLNTWQQIINALPAIAICLLLIVKLAQMVVESAKSKNWIQLVIMVVTYVAEAEKRISDSATRKEWVIGMIRASAATLDYTITESDWKKISDLVDVLCKMAKNVNVNPREAGER